LLTTPIFTEDITYGNRTGKQLKFILNYSKNNGLSGKHFTSKKEVDQRVKTLSNEWQKHIQSDDPVFIRFDGYPLFVISLLDGNKKWVTDHIVIKYMLPNLIKDIQFIKKDPNEISLSLLNRPTYDNVIGMALKTDVKPGLWNKWCASMHSLLAIIDVALKRNQLNKEMRKVLVFIKNRLKDTEKNYELLDAIYNDRLIKGYGLLQEAFSERMIVQRGLVRPAKFLADKFQAQNQKKRAFKILDLLFQFTIEPELPRDRLKSWYLAIDKEEGTQRFKVIRGKPVQSILIRSQFRNKLKGIYQNLTSEESLDLSKVENNYILIDFWTSWCGPCQKEIPDLKKFYSRYMTKKNIVFISVVCDGVDKGLKPADIIKLIKHKNIKYPVLYDTKEKSLVKQFGVRGYPLKVLLDRDGYILERTHGRRYVNLDIAEAFFRNLQKQ
jgi:thiol-disulfide isomerase/thioredoxin